MNARACLTINCFKSLPITGVILAILLCIGSPAIAQGPPEGVGFDQRLGEKVPLGLKFKDEHGKEVELKSYFGDKAVILMPVYYKCPMLCGLELNGLVRCLRALKMSVGMTAEKDFEIVTFSIDHREGAQLAGRKRKQYLAQYDCPEADEGWHFLTGQETDIEKLCQAIGFRSKYDEASGQYAHAAGLVVCTPGGVISRYLYGVEFAPKDLRLAVVESGQGEIGSLTDHILLFCYRYDPTKGKYGLAILNLLRVSGVLTVLVLAGAVSWMIRKDRTTDPLSSVTEGGPHE